MNSQTPSTKSVSNSSSGSKSKKSRTRHKRKNAPHTTPSAAKAAEAKPDAEDLVAAVAAAIDADRSVTVENSVDGKSATSTSRSPNRANSSPSSPKKSSKPANLKSPAKKAKSYAAAAALSPATAEVSAATKDSLDSLMDGGGSSVLGTDGDAVSAAEPPEELPVPLSTPISSSSVPDTNGDAVSAAEPPEESPVPLSTPVSSSSVPDTNGDAVSAAEPPEESPAPLSISTPTDIDAPVGVVEAEPTRSATPPATLSLNVLDPAGENSMDTVTDTEEAPRAEGGCPPHGDLLNGTPALAAVPGGPSSEDDNWSRKSTVNTESLIDNTSVLSETDALALEDPIVAVSRSMSVEAPMDTYAEALAKGIECEVHGLVIPYGWTWCHEGPILRAYTALAEEIHSLEADVDFAGRCCYVYAPSELHCTVATLSSFKEVDSYFATLELVQGRSAEEARELRREVMELWKGAVERQFTALPSPPQATVDRIEVCESAIIFHLQPLDDALERMRVAVRAAAEDNSFREYEINSGLSPYELTRLIHIPKISHSTFVRFRKRPSPELRNRLQEVVGRWTPHRVEMHGMKLVYENRPYMHIDVESTIVMTIEGKPQSPPAVVIPAVASAELEESAPKTDVGTEASQPTRPPTQSSARVATRVPKVTTAKESRVGAAAACERTAPPIPPTRETNPPNDEGSGSGWALAVAGVVVVGIIGVVAMGIAKRR